MNNSFLYKLERKFGRYAIQRLPLIMIMCYGVGYLIALINANFLNYLTLEPYYILHGQIWRIVTWILIPPSSSNIFFVLITLMFYYSIGMQLERVWGTFFYNLYILSGMLFTVVGVLILYGVLYGVYQGPVSFGGIVTTYYINMSIFLAYAATFPENEVLLMFILPIKVKWLGIVYAALIVYDMLSIGNLVYAAVIVFSMLNFILFFFLIKKSSHLSRAQRNVRKNFRQQTAFGAGSNAHMKSGNSAISRHKCAVCGQTELTNPNLSFRFCTKCDGNYEYCENHIFTHTHVHR